MKTLLALVTFLALAIHTQAKPLKIFILAGQSNMEGHAKVETFDYIGDDPATAPLIEAMRGRDGKPAVCNHVWISYFTGIGDANGEGFGKLTAGFGSRQNPTQDGGKIGPEFTFGLAMDAALTEPVLIIKTAWGGKSLHTDFRPPSAGPYTLSAFQKANYPKQEGHGIPKDFEKWKADKIQETGHYYRLMIEHVKRVTKDIKRVCPVYDERQGFEIAGFVWFQGFNDLVASETYDTKPGSNVRDYSKYSEWLADFIRDVRKDLNAPKMPFVIGVLGVDGLRAKEGIIAFREAMAAPATLPEFAGNVVAVFDKMLRNSLDGVNRDQLRKAVAAALRNEDGRARGSVGGIFKKLDYEEIAPLLPAIRDAITTPAPSGEMFADNIRMAGLALFTKFHISQGIGLLADYARTQNQWSSENRTVEIMKLLQNYGTHAKRAVPKLEAVISYFEHGEKNFPPKLTEKKVQAVRETIAAIQSSAETPTLINL